MSSVEARHILAFRRACSLVSDNKDTRDPSFTSVLDIIAQDLARDEALRKSFGSDTSIWRDLRKSWRDLSDSQLTFWDCEDSEAEAEDAPHTEKTKLGLTATCISLAKFTRNLVANVPDNQVKAFEIEPEMRRLLHYHTSWYGIEDTESITASRFLIQALSNTVTGNEELLSRLWETYLNLSEDQVVLLRLMTSNDARILLSTLILILNCLHRNRKRTKMLTKSTVGVRICVGLLDKMVTLYDAEEETEASQAFDIGYQIFSRVIEEGYVPDLYHRFAMTDEIITPHQTTLLKLIDSYLQSLHTDLDSVIKPESIQLHHSMCPFISKIFYDLSTYAQNSMKRSLPQSERNNDDTTRKSIDDEPSGVPRKAEDPDAASQDPVPSALDVMLPKVCEALVLVAQCISTIALDAEVQKGYTPKDSELNEITNTKNYFNETRSYGQCLVESLLELLRLLDLFLPRINFGKVVAPLVEHPHPIHPILADAGFSYLKRDLVRLLGVLCHEERSVQDRVRNFGGIQIVMNMCVVDERNPYLREHGLFTLHILLHNNAENQALVDSIRPSAEWDAEGVLKQKNGAVLK